MTVAEKPQIFLSYAHDDVEKVRKLYADLTERKVNVWFDKQNLSPGRWLPQISKAIARSRYFVLCVSASVLRKLGDHPGYVDKELEQAYEIAKVQDERTFGIIPVRLEKELERGDNRLSMFQQYDLFENWDATVDKLAVYFGGESLNMDVKKEKQSDEERLHESIIGKATVAYLSKNYDEALPLFDKALEINSQDADTWYAKGVTLGHKGRYEDALASLEQALTLDADHWLATLNKANILNIMGRYDDAIPAYQEAIDIDPGNALAWLGKGLALKNIRHNEDALTAFEKVEAINPEIDLLWNGKGGCAKVLHC